MDDNDEQIKPSDRLSLFFAFMAMSFFFVFFMFPSESPIDNYHLLRPGPMTIKEGMGIGIQNKDHEDLISQIREDLKIHPSLYIKIFVGPYQDITGEGIMIPLINPPGILILIDQNLYQVLNTEERMALIAHELGHLTNEEMLLDNGIIRAQFQIQADIVSTRYTPPEAMISVINKIVARRGGTKPFEFELRIRNLEAIKQSRQNQQVH